MKKLFIVLFASLALAACGGGGEAQPLTKGADMSAGFQVTNPTTGAVQIDENYANLVLTNKGTVTIPPTSIAGGIGFITVDAETPVLAIDTGGEEVVIASMSRIGNTFTYGLKASGSSTVISTLVTWYVFDKMPNVVANMGLTVYDATGRVTFNSDYKPMRVVDTLSIPNGTPASGVPPSSYGINAAYAGQKLAGLLSLAKSYVGSGGAAFYLFQQGVKVNNTLTFSSVGTSTYNFVRTVSAAANGQEQPIGGQLVAIDVTGL